MNNLRLDFVIDKTLRLTTRTAAQQALEQLADIKLNEPEATHTLERIREHKWYVSERLGRDVGMRVAAVDFFENIAPQITVKKHHRHGLPPRLRFMQPMFS